MSLCYTNKGIVSILLQLGRNSLFQQKEGQFSSNTGHRLVPVHGPGGFGPLQLVVKIFGKESGMMKKFVKITKKKLLVGKE